VIATTPQIQGGKLKGIAVSSATRSLSLPDVPTFIESGLKDFDLAAWNIWLAPKGTPDVIVGKLNAAINGALQKKDVQQKLLQLGYIPAGTRSPAGVAEFVRSETS
jgi:tripartite-type tricarboxylate transporter receptor subunit TctC